MKIQIVIFDGFDELDVLGVYEPLRMAGLDVKLLTLKKQDVVIAANGLKIVPDGIIDLNDKPDILCIPGGGWVSGSQHGALAEANSGKILSVLNELHAAGVIFAAVCTGVLLLGRAGILLNRYAVTNHQTIEELRECGANVIQARVVDDGDIITAAGVTSSLDLGLWLIERFVSADKASEVSKTIEFKLREPVWKNPRTPSAITND